MLADGSIDRHLLDGITIFGLLFGMLGSFYLAYDVFRLPILKKLTWFLTCALPPAIITMGIVGAAGLPSSHNKADVLKSMLESGLYWGLFAAGTVYYTLRTQPYESRLQEIFSFPDTVRGLVVGAFLGLILALVFGDINHVIPTVIFGSLLTGTLCSCLGYLRSKRLGPIVLLLCFFMGVLVGSGLDGIGIHVASGPDAAYLTLLDSVILGLAAAPASIRLKQSVGQKPGQASQKEEDKSTPAPSQSSSRQTRKQQYRRRQAAHQNQQHLKTLPAKPHLASHARTVQEQQLKQEPPVQKHPDDQAQHDKTQQEVQQNVQARPAFYSTADAFRGFMYGAMLSGLTSAYIVNQHPSLISDLIVITALFGGLLAMVITGIGRFAVWWADHLENRQLGKIGLTLLEIGVVLTLIQPLADLLDLVH